MFFSLQIASTLLSMLKDPCDDVNCGFNGYCKEGLCLCVNGYTGVLCGIPPKVNGGYSSWTEWTPCSASCDDGTQTRYRECNSPAPAYGGEDCTKLGPDTDSKICNLGKCTVAVDGGYSDWSPWTKCSNSCPTNGKGGYYIGTSQRIRTCTNPAPGGGGLDVRISCS